LSTIRNLMNPSQAVRGSYGSNQSIETSDGVRDRVLESAEFIPLKSFRAPDDCSFSPLADDTAFAKIVPR
jgi:hypothetical protein